MKVWSVVRVSAAVFALAACEQPQPEPPVQPDAGAEVDSAGFRAPEPATIARNSELAAAEWLNDDADFELAMRGLIASEPALEIRNEAGDLVWRPADYAFLDDEAGASINPSLRRQARLNNIHGLFEVAPGIYQVRGYDLANMSIIEGETGWIIIDPLTSVETVRAAMALVDAELGERPIEAVIVTHSHIDHFGGLLGIASAEDYASGRVELIAPADFLEHAVSENIMAGVVMGRRATYMYGTYLPRSPRGHVGSGLGKAPALGTYTIAEPSRIIDETGTTLEIDGVEMVFHYAPNTEAPAELTVFFPQHNAWCGAEIVSRNMHNLYTLRGAQVRNPIAWSAAIDEALRLFGPQTDVIFNSHHWPVWGRDEATAFLERQRDIYKYIHDQTLRLAASGLGPDEIAEVIELPAELETAFDVRGYYGTLRHNSRAVYQRYFGWYDGVPAHLDPVPRTEAAARYVAGFGGMDAILAQAETAFAEGDYRWSAELAQHAVFAQPDVAAARELLARSYEQLGYQAESGPWRDVYLSGAFELRNGQSDRDIAAAIGSIMTAIPLDMFFASMATSLDGPRASGLDLRFNFNFTDVDERYVIEVSNGVMRHREGSAEDDVDATVTLTRAFWLRLLAQEAGLGDMIMSEEFAVEGDRRDVLTFFSLFDQAEPNFPIVTP